MRNVPAQDSPLPMSSRVHSDQPLTRSQPAGQGVLEKKFVLNPITALSFFTSISNGRLYLLAGEENHLKIYDVATSSLRGKLSVFKAQSIHGIAVPRKDAPSQEILLWGGRSVAMLHRDDIEAIISSDATFSSLRRPVFEVVAPDWIFDGMVSPYGSGEVFLLTAHNEIIQTRLYEGQNTVDLGKVTSPSRPILYSGKLYWESEDCILVAAGTVFGEIIVWKYHIGSTERASNCEVLFVFSGHEGSIFGVDISSPIQLRTGECLRLLSSCSDDRTIRVWDISEAQDSSPNTHARYQDKLGSARETGFGDSVEVTAQYETSTRCLAVAMGHVSRIWQAKFSPRQSLLSDDSGVELWSFGEDATAHKWALSLGELISSSAVAEHETPESRAKGMPAQLQHQATFSVHSGKNIWSQAITDDDSGNFLIATGGSDGKISLIESIPESVVKTLSDVPASDITVLTPTEVMTEQIESPHVPLETAKSNSFADCNVELEKKKKPMSQKQIARKARETFQRWTFISEDRLLAVTNKGRLLLGTFEPDISWKGVGLDPTHSKALLSYSVIAASTTSSVALIGTAGGHVFIYRDSHTPQVELLTTLQGKVADIFHLSSLKISSPEDEATLGTLETADPGREAVRSVFLVTSINGSVAFLLHINPSSEVSKTIREEISVEKGFTTTAAAICGQYIILGSRNGRISVLERNQNGGYDSKHMINGTITEAVTSISILPKGSQGSSMYFLTTSRDGKYRIFNLIQIDGQLDVVLLHETSPPFGPMIEGAWFSKGHDGAINLTLCGFRGKDFIVWIETRRRETVRVDCGGGHRIFSYTQLARYPDGIRLVFTKASQLHVFSQTRTPHQTLKTGGHGREIKAVSASGQYLATGAEDTTIRIWDYDDQKAGSHSEPNCLAVLEKHTTGIQTLKWHGKDYLFSSGGNEGFFVWKTTELDSAYKGLAVFCEAVFPDRTEDGDLRIMDFDVQCLRGGEGPVFCISMALSNSTLQTYTYSKQAGFRLLARGSYTGACLTQLRHLQVDDTTIQTLTASTDGHIAIWKTKNNFAVPDVQAEVYESTVVTRLHQNSIKALDVRATDTEDGTSYLVVTGGDDNALGVIHFQADSTTGGFSIRSNSTVKSAHAAAVTGITILGGEAQGGVATVVTASNDQRVKKWHLADWQSRKIRAVLVDNRYSSVADASVLEALDGDRVIIGGVGLEVWRTSE